MDWITCRRLNGSASQLKARFRNWRQLKQPTLQGIRKEKGRRTIWHQYVTWESDQANVDPIQVDYGSKSFQAQSLRHLIFNTCNKSTTTLSQQTLHLSEVASQDRPAALSSFIGLDAITLSIHKRAQLWASNTFQGHYQITTRQFTSDCVIFLRYYELFHM